MIDEDLEGAEIIEIEKEEKKVERGRRITVIFSNEGKEGNLELWVEPDETVGKVKDQVSRSTQNWFSPYVYADDRFAISGQHSHPSRSA